GFVSLGWLRHDPGTARLLTFSVYKQFLLGS
ncbi:hypothetical protein CMV_028039, partial [Castanea mollissima]